MIKISKLADYATVIMNFLSAHPKQQFSAAVIAEKVHISAPTVSKLLKLLLEADLLASSRGTNGGYQLAREPSEISVSEVIMAIDGQPGMTDCCRGEQICANDKHCDLRGNWQYLNAMINDILSNVTLSDMAKPLHSSMILQKMSEHN